MYLDERSNLLLKEVIGNPEVSNLKLEQKYQLSRRQVSYSFKKINDWLMEKNYPPIKRTNTGKFIIHPVLINLFSDLAEDSNKNNRYITSEKERAQLILLMMLSSAEELSLIHFSYALEVSKNTILRDLKYAQTIIHAYQLEIVYSRVQGYDLLGSEWQKRKLLVDVLEELFLIYNGEHYIQKLANISSSEIQQVKKQMEEIEFILYLKFSDDRMKLLQYVISILFKRIDNGNIIEDSFHIDYDELFDTKEFEAAEILVRDIENFPKEERLFLTLQLLSSNISSYQFLSDKEIPQLRKALKDSLDLFEKKACVTLKNKESFLEKLFQHMKPAYYRIKYRLTTNYQMFEKASREFEAIDYIVKESIKPLEEYIKCKIPENELIFITILIGGHLMNSGETISIKKKAVVVCPNGVSISKLMENTLRDLFPEFYFYDAQSIREFAQKDVDTDIVFSPVPIQTCKKLFLVDRFITDFEKVQLRQRVMKEVFELNSSVINVDQIIHIVEKYANIEEKESLVKGLQEYFTYQVSNEIAQKGNYHLSDLITPDTIISKDHVNSWHEAIECAAQPLLEKGIITNSYIEAMRRQYPTISPYIVLRMNIAIPHASPEDGVNSVGMSLLRIKDGISLDGDQKIHFISVIAAVDKNQHLNALLQLMKLAGTTEDMNKILELEDKEEIFRIIQEYVK